MPLATEPDMIRAKSAANHSIPVIANIANDFIFMLLSYLIKSFIRKLYNCANLLFQHGFACFHKKKRLAQLSIKNLI